MLQGRLRAFGLALAIVVAGSSTAFARSVTLAWDPNPETDIAGYIVYRGAVCGSYSSTADAGNQTTYTFTSLPDNEAHCFVVQAYNAAGERGPLSDPVSIAAPTGPNPRMNIDVPAANARVSQPFVVGGWAIDLGSTSGVGVDMIHGYAYPASGAPPVFLGVAGFGGARPDVGAVFGATFTNCGFGIGVTGLAAGDYLLVIYAHSTVTGTFNNVGLRTVTILPAPIMTIDTPSAGSMVSQPFVIDGWAIDQSSTRGTGIDAVNVFAYPNPGSGAPPVFLGWTAYGSPRPDVAASFGAQFMNSRVQFAVDGLPPAPYLLEFYAHSTVTNLFSAVQRIAVTVKGRPRMNVDLPVQNGTVARTFRVAGWAIDLEAASGSGVDYVHAYAYNENGAPPILLQAATLDIQRPDVAAAYGSSQFSNAGFFFDATLAPGTYNVVIYAHSTVTNTFNNVQLRRINVQ